jgi:hypothetical protein
MKLFPCPTLGGNVELTDEREAHIAFQHPDLLPEFLAEIGETLAEPEEVRTSRRISSERRFYRWFHHVREGKYIAVVVVSETAPKSRHWIVTSYITRRLPAGADL